MSLEKELESARKRLASQTVMLEGAKQAQEEAIRRGLGVTAKSYAARIKRYQDTVDVSRQIVQELEAAIGAPKQSDLVEETKRKR